MFEEPTRSDVDCILPSIQFDASQFSSTVGFDAGIFFLVSAFQFLQHGLLADTSQSVSQPASNWLLAIAQD